MKSALRLGIGIALAVALLALAMRGVDFEALFAAMAHASPLPLVGLMASTVLLYFIRAMRWRLLLPALAKARVFDLFGITLIGFMSALFIPRAGEVLRPYLASRRYGVSVTSGLAAIILERLVDLITVLSLLALYMFVLPTPAAERPGTLMTTLRLGAGLTFLAAVVGMMFLAALRVEGGMARRLLNWALGLLPASIAGKVRGLVESFIAGLDVFGSSAAQWTRLVGESLLLWLVIGMVIHLASIAFGFGLPFHTVFLITAFLTVGVAIPTPGNVGGFHASYTLAMTQVYGIDQGKAVAAAIVLHALQNLPVLVLGIAFLGREGLSFGQIDKITKE